MDGFKVVVDIINVTQWYLNIRSESLYTAAPLAAP
jgi:hypothetical protein